MAEVIDELIVRISGDASDLESTINSVSGELSKLDRQQNGNNLSKSAGKVAESWQKAGKSIKDFGEGFDKATKPLQNAAVALSVGGVAAAKFAVDFENNFANVKKTVDGTPEQLEKIRQEIIDMSTVGINGHSAIPQTTAELTELAAAGGQLGIETERIAGFTETMAMLGTATNLSGEQGAQTLARFMNVTNTSQTEIGNLGSAIVDLGNNFATTEAEIADMALNMGATGNVVGISAQDVLAYSTALSSLGVEAAAGGSAVSRIWMDIQSAVSSGGETLQKFAKLSGMSSAEFKKQWQTDASGAFQKFLKGLNNDKDQISTLADLGFNNIRDIQALQRLAGEKGFNLLTEAIERSNTAWAENTALQTEFDAKAETTASQLKIAKNNAIEAARSFGEIMLPSIVSVTGSVSSFTQHLAKMSDGGKKTIVTAGAVTVGLGALSKGTASAIKTIGGAMEGYDNIKKALSAGGTLAKFAPTLASIGSVAGPAALGIAATATATVGLYEAAKAYEEYKADWSRGGEEMAKSIKSHVETTRELNDLQYEFRTLQGVINNPQTDENTLNVSKVRLEEIKKLLSEKYNLDITVNDSELDAAIEKAKQIQLLETKQDIPDLLNYAKSRKSDYKGDLNDQSLYNQNIEGIKQQQEATRNFRSELLLLNDTYKKGSISQEEYTQTFNKLVEATGNPTFKNTPVDALLNSNSIDDWLSRLESNLTNNETLLSKIEAKTSEFVGAMQDLANAGLLEIEFGDTEQGLSHIATAVKSADLSMNDWAKTAAVAMSEVDSLQTAWKQAWEGNGTALDNVVNGYIRSMQEFGASAQETATGASLIKNGFRTIEDAVSDGKLDEITAQANELAHSMGLIPADKHIVINASGDISIIEDVQSAVDNVNASGDVQLTVSATGDVSILETADEKLQELINNNQVTVTFNAQTNGFDISNLQGDKIGQITADGKINWTQGEIEKPKDEKADGTIDYKLGEVAKPENAIAEGTINYKIGRVEKPKPNARGTQNFSGGLALVNDDGHADPRELIIDRGRAFIPEGRDVILPLSRGAKVYTSEQTKAIMSGLGIPRYASGKNNSDAFTSAKDNWTHYTKTHSVTTEQELQKWLEFQEKYKENEKDIWDIEEQVFSLQQKITKELNDQSKAYLSERSALNDWEDIGDSPLSALARVKDRNMADLQAGRQTWDDYVNNVSSAGETLYDDMKKYSDGWLEHQRKYHNMSIDEYIAGIDREQERLEKFYAEDAVNHQKYIEEKQALEEKRFDAVAEKNADEYSAWKKDADAWQEMRSTYGDWDKYGDSEEAFLKRKIDRVKEMYAAGTISFEEYIDDTTRYSMDLYKAQEGYVDDLLQKQQDYISEMREQFQKEEQALQDSWAVADRKTDMSEVQAQLDIYSGAVTDRGQQKYKELQEQMKQLQRDEELYNLQVRNNATLEGLEADYKTLEENKANVLNELRATDMDISSYVESLTQNISQSSGNVEGLLNKMLTVFQNFKVETNPMTDNRKITYNLSQLSPEQIQEFCNFVVGK